METALRPLGGTGRATAGRPRTTPWPSALAAAAASGESTGGAPRRRRATSPRSDPGRRPCARRRGMRCAESGRLPTTPQRSGTASGDATPRGRGHWRRAATDPRRAPATPGAPRASSRGARPSRAAAPRRGPKRRSGPRRAPPRTQRARPPPSPGPRRGGAAATAAPGAPAAACNSAQWRAARGCSTPRLPPAAAPPAAARASRGGGAVESATPSANPDTWAANSPAPSPSSPTGPSSGLPWRRGRRRHRGTASPRARTAASPHDKSA
mmetsp:Transcript_20440/g.57851  ORF Transcript_20440/g.57851 Transcript_20440/m.57851 type:complete len:268 (-) Transcript_20440:83-886(-)